MTATAIGVVVIGTLAACDMTYGIGTVVPAPALPAQAEAARKLDVLVVVDNSASMATKQKRFFRTLFDPDCPIADFAHVPASLLHPTGDQRAALAKTCGFLQLLVADERDFRVGFITTDVDACDNLAAQNARTPRAQRGCLQGDGVVKFVARADAAFAPTLARIEDGIGTFGNPYQRAFDAVLAFAHPDDFVADACRSDATSFLRDDADLLVVIASDKDDCSHADTLDDVASAFTSCTVDDADVTATLFGGGRSPAHCATASLTSTSDVAAAFTALKKEPTHMALAVVAGAVTDAAGSWKAGGCLLATNGVPVVQCTDADDLFGLTPSACPLSAPSPCCDAHFGARLYDVATKLPASPGSICARDDVLELDAAAALLR